MKTNVYAVLDAKVGAFGSLYLDLTDDAAIRTFSDRVNDSNPQNSFSRHSEDYTLYRIGQFDGNVGAIEPVKVLVALVTASAVKSLNSGGVNEESISNSTRLFSGSQAR